MVKFNSVSNSFLSIIFFIKNKNNDLEDKVLHIQYGGSVDLNTIVKPGCYALSTECVNTPMDEGLDISIDYSPLLVVRGNSDTLAQLCFNYHGGGIVVREANNIGNGLEPHWQPWKKIVFQNDLANIGDISTFEDRISKLESQIDEALYEVIEQTGTFDIKSSGSQSWTKVGTFSRSFVEIPTITFSLSGETGRITSGPTVSSVTLANVTVKFSSYSQGSSYSFTVKWHAVGKVIKK